MSQLCEETLQAEDLLAAIASDFCVLENLQSPLDRIVETAKVMIVDDEPINVKLVRKVLQEVGFVHFCDVTDPRETLGKMLEAKPDVVLLDIMMPYVSGLEVLKAIRMSPKLQHTPVIILTATTDRPTKLRALELGATDFLAKPVDRAELIPRVRNVLSVKSYQDHMRNYNIELEKEVKQRTAELVTAQMEVVNCLARAADFRDDVTGQHVFRVGQYAGLIALAMGMNSEESHLLSLAAQLHDVGKIGIPDQVLNKADKLTQEEFAVMQQHCGMGKRVFDGMDERQLNHLRKHPTLGSELLSVSASPLIQLASRIALTHHERWDGTGYPMGLTKEEIPLEGRITAVADVFDALSSQRPYKPAYSLSKCFELLEQGRGTQFDPEVLDAFLKQREAIIAVQIEYAE